ncbi:MAG: hypothetical protein ACTSU6_00955 [Candidatus Njordarchaeales archaeon]
MGKMSDRRRKRKKNKVSSSKLLELLQKITLIKAPTPPTGYAFKSKKDYDRKNNKKVVKKLLENE